MEWSVELAPEGYVRVRTRGEFTVADHGRMVEDVLSRPFWRPGLGALFDHRAADLSRVDYALMRGASQNHKRNAERIGDGKAAVVVATTTDYGSIRQFQNLLGPESATRFAIFRDVEEAEEWLTAG